jgi:hypothetical protein
MLTETDGSFVEVGDKPVNLGGVAETVSLIASTRGLDAENEALPAGAGAAESAGDRLEGTEPLTARYRKLASRGKRTTVACTAIARELVGFMWAVAREARAT